MSLNKLLFSIIIIIVNVGVKSDKITFRNVTILSDGEELTTVSESNNLKDFLPDEELWKISVIGIVPVLRKDSVSDITNVKNLELSKNNIEEIEAGAFKNLNGLEKLVITHNNLTRLVENIFENVPIEYLDLSNNQIENISKEVFKNLPNLMRLNLDNNKIKTLENGVFTNVQSLNMVRLSRNVLESIPNGLFNNHPNLRDIRIQNNQIASIDSEAFDNMSKLTDIYLGHNKLTNIDPHWFKNTPNILHLDLESNQIEEIPDEAFKNIYNDKGQFIGLNNNKIKRVSRNAFKGFRNIEVLLLDDNDIDHWNGDFLEHVDFINLLGLHRNKISCPEGDFDQVFKAHGTDLGCNNLTEDCVEKIDKWKKNHNKNVLTECSH